LTGFSASQTPPPFLTKIQSLNQPTKVLQNNNLWQQLKVWNGQELVVLERDILVYAKDSPDNCDSKTADNHGGLIFAYYILHRHHHSPSIIFFILQAQMLGWDKSFLRSPL
jgi:hypothetical protein